MSGAEIGEKQDPEALTTESDKGAADGGESPRPSTGGGRRQAFAVARAIVVLAIAGAGFAIVIPTHHDRQTRVVTSRLSQLVLGETGVKGFNTKPTDSGVQTASNAGITVLTNAAKQDPGHTGLYARDWASSAKGSSDALGLVVFLLPTPADAETVMSQVSKQQLAASAQSANSLDRHSTFAFPGITGSAGSIFVPKKPSKTTQDLAVGIFRNGRVVSFVQSAITGDADTTLADVQANATAVAKAQSALVQKVEPGFNMVEVVRPAGTSIPTTASIVWIAGSLVVAGLAGWGPLAIGRARRRRAARLQAELDRMIVVRGQTITKRRR